MLDRVRQAVTTIEEAQAEGRKHLCLTDPDARMLGEGRTHQVRECHAWEVATDNGSGSIVASGVTTECDNGRLLPLVEAARKHEPKEVGVTAVDGDSGFWRGDAIAQLERAGIDTCIPDSNTAGDLHRGLPVGSNLERSRGSGGKVPFTYEAENDRFTCPEGNVLRFAQERCRDGQEQVRVYRAEAPCTNCSRAPECLCQSKAKRRTHSAGVDQELLRRVLARFDDPKRRERYRMRGCRIETVFGFVRSVLGFTRWLLRGTERVTCEASLFTVAYNARKLHKALAAIP